MVRRNHVLHTGVIVKVDHTQRKSAMESKPRSLVFSLDSRISIQPFYQYLLSTSGVPAPALDLGDSAENATNKVPGWLVGFLCVCVCVILILGYVLLI